MEDYNDCLARNNDKKKGNLSLMGKWRTQTPANSVAHIIILSPISTSPPQKYPTLLINIFLPWRYIISMKTLLLILLLWSSLSYDWTNL